MPHAMRSLPLRHSISRLIPQIAHLKDLTLSFGRLMTASQACDIGVRKETPVQRGILESAGLHGGPWGAEHPRLRFSSGTGPI
jgi:hypothetical protein